MRKPIQPLPAIEQNNLLKQRTTALIATQGPEKSQKSTIKSIKMGHLFSQKADQLYIYIRKHSTTII